MIPENCSQHQDWELYALGVLEGDEQRDMEAHLAFGCETCKSAYLSTQAIVSALASTAPEVELSPHSEMLFRQRLEGKPFAVLPMPEQRARWDFRTFAAWLAAAACLFTAVGLALSRLDLARELAEQKRVTAAFQQELLYVSKTNPSGTSPPDPKGDPAELRRTIEKLRIQFKAADAARLIAEQKLATVQAKLATAQERVHVLDASMKDAEAHSQKAETALADLQMQTTRLQEDAARFQQISAENERITALLDAGSLSQLDLKPVGNAHATARVYWQNDRGLLLVARSLPLLPEHASFQLWFYRHGTTDLVHVGTLTVGRSGDGLVYVPPGPALLAMSGALVTIQPQAGGSAPGQEILRIKP